MNKLYLSILTIFLAVGLSQAQSLKAYQKAAVKAEENNNYSEALANYQVIINSAGKETADNFYRAAENARQMRVYPLAESYYLKVLNGGEADNYPTLQFWLGDIKKRLGKYDEAKAHFEQYLSTTGADGDLSNRANKEIADCVWALDRVQSPDVIQMQSIGTEINTASTEIAPLLRDDVFYFSSLREDPTDISCDFAVTRMYMAKANANEAAEFTKITAGSAMQVDQNFNQGNKHTAHTAFNQDGSRIYYTLCEDLDDKTKCEIFYRNKQGDTWGEAVALPEGINHPEYTATQVSVGVSTGVGQTETEILFFASDRPGGKGGMDIWCSLMRADGKWGFPVAVPDVNTPGNDITPFFDTKSQKLYFSSEGMADENSVGFDNLGGFDIYKVQKNGNEWGAVEHMGYPLNGGYDDMYYSLNSGKKKAHFTSNRPGGICADTSQYCVCNDIYEVNMPSSINLRVITINELTNELTSEELFNVGVELTEKGVANFPKQAPPVDPEGNLYEKWTVDFGKNYTLIGAREGYGSKTIEFTTPPPVIGDTTITVIIPLRPQLALDVLTFEKSTGDPLNGVTVHFYELPDDKNSKSKLREEFSHEYLYENEVDFGHRYMVIGTKEKYTSDTAYVTSEELKIEPQANLLAKLYLCEIGVTELPNVTLYFDNDIPKRNKAVPPYNVTYNKYVDDYYNYKAGGYYARESVHTPELQSFFNNEVKAGFEKLDLLGKELLNYFEGPSGSGFVEIRIEGNASNLNDKEYNKKLTERRIKSLDEYFNTWVDKETGRSLAKYGSRMKVQRVANGLELARKSYTNSKITDVEACRDRNVRIVGINITKSKCEGAVISKPKTEPEPDPTPYTGPVIELDVLTFDKMTGDALNGVTVDFYEMPKMPSKLSKREDNANSYHYNIDFERRYMVIGTKAGYTPDTAYVTTENIKREAATLLRELYLCKSGLNSLPGVTLYFDNDEPEPDNMRTVCSYGYDRAYNEYISSYDNRTGYYANAKVHSADMQSFFENDVKQGFADLERLAMDLLNYFESVDASAKVEITMRGHASLRSNPRYNKALTKRRISSVQNYFGKWVDQSTGRSLAQYKERIKVTEAPAGDEEACRGCYVKTAITDVKACQDRRVEIIGVQFTKSVCDTEKNIYNKK